MNVTVEALSPVSKQLILEVPGDEVTRALDEQFRRLGKVVSVRGFRAGKVPKELVRKLYAADAQQEAAKSLLTRHFQAALAESGIKPLVMPEITNEEVKAGTPLKYSIICDVMPEFEPVDIDDLELPAERTEPTDEELESRIQALREKHADAETVEGRGADTGDIVEIQYSGRVMGEESAFTGEEPITAQPVLGKEWRYPAITDRLMGASAGDTLSVGTTLPEDWRETELAGKEVLFDVTVVSVSRRVLPDVDDAFAQDAGFADVGAMRAKVYDDVAAGLRSGEAQQTERAITDALLAKNDVAVPEPLLRQQVDEAIRHIANNFREMGLNDDLISRLVDREAQSIVANSRRAVQRDLVLDKLAEPLGVEVTDADVESSLSDLADRMRMPLAKIKGQLDKAGGLEDYRMRMRRERTMKALAARARAKTA